ncbi:MAG TPA: DUF1634 domain-containing protein [Candidatus Limnocylindrales bacterium]|jgi:uncharacterized membrane protein|nr:DUF1634 domain-containing protein [Candidatus Limnocylindrales bacterium]
MRVLVARVLTAGIIVSAVLLIAALASALALGWGGSLLGRPVVTASLTDFGGLIDGLGALRPAAIGQLGLLALVLTPVTRVAASILLFGLEGDRTYVLITAAVLAILLASLLFIR